MLQPAKKIVVIAPDVGLRQSLMFALEVEGYKVEAHSSWCGETISLASSICLIIDDQVLRTDPDARYCLLNPKYSIITLTDGMSEPVSGNPGVTLAKPFEAADLLRLVRSMAALAA